jgi:hypothetical protein
MYSLSWLPVNRPLRWLPVYHGIITAALLAWTLRRDRRGAWRESLRRTLSGLAGAVRQSGLMVALALLGLPIVLGIYVRFGAYSTPECWDELECHVPHAVQPYLDGRVGVMTSDQLTVDTYPRGGPLLWAWTLQMTGTDLLLHPTQTAFGAVLLLATWVLARRSGVATWAASLAVIAIATAPIFGLLSTIGYVDVPHVAAVMAMLAFLAPPRFPERSATRDWLPAAVAFALSCEIKYPFLPGVFAGLAVIQTLLFRGRARAAIRETSRFMFSRRGLLSIAVVAASCHLYLSHWIHHGNPFYILSLDVGPWTIFKGPCPSSLLDAWGKSSSPKPVGDMSRLERYYHSWTDLEVPLTTNSFGAFGPVLPFALAVPALGFMLIALLGRSTWGLALSAMLLFCIFMTPSQVPRYGLGMFVLLTICAAGALSQLPGRTRIAYALVTLGLCYLGLRTGLEHFHNRLRQYRHDVGWSWKARSAYFLERYQLGADWFASPQMVKFVRDRSGAGDLLAWNVRTFPTMLLNRQWNNRPYYLGGSPLELWPLGSHLFPPVKPEELAAWVQKVGDLQPRHILVYARSDYARFLRDHPETGYRVVFEDGPERREYAMILFERGADMPRHAQAGLPPLRSEVAQSGHWVPAMFANGCLFRVGHARIDAADALG